MQSHDKWPTESLKKLKNRKVKWSRGKLQVIHYESSSSPIIHPRQLTSSCRKELFFLVLTPKQNMHGILHAEWHITFCSQGMYPVSADVQYLMVEWSLLWRVFAPLALTTFCYLHQRSRLLYIERYQQFVEDIEVGCLIKSESDTWVLQNELDDWHEWSNKWMMHKITRQIITHQNIQQ